MIWRKFRHPNILPFLGICTDEFAPQMALVSPWMENGNIHIFLKQNPSANRVSLVRILNVSFPLVIDGYCKILGTARGLEYLHHLEPKVVHGDLRGVSIIIQVPILRGVHYDYTTYTT